VLVAVAVAGLVLSASACGGGKKSDTTSASTEWAGSVCSAFTTWKNSLQDIKTNLTEGGLSSLSSSQLRQAGRQAESATQTLARSLDKLGKPDTANGQEAKDNLKTLENSLTDSMNTIESAVPRNPSMADLLSALPTVQTEFTKMSNDLKTAVGNLKQSDPGGELEKAFKDAPSCSAYVAS
jgi:uncharacterized protein involved in exopolysaccharide biosynthesis